MRQIDAKAAMNFLRGQKVKETGAFSKGVNKGINIALAALGSEEITPTIGGPDDAPAYWVGTRFDGYADGNPVYDLWECSNCGEEYESEGSPPAYRFCHGCGKPMAEEPIWRG